MYGQPRHVPRLFWIVDAGRCVTSECHPERRAKPGVELLRHVVSVAQAGYGIEQKRAAGSANGLRHACLTAVTFDSKRLGQSKQKIETRKISSKDRQTLRKFIADPAAPRHALYGSASETVRKVAYRGLRFCSLARRARPAKVRLRVPG